MAALHKTAFPHDAWNAASLTTLLAQTGAAALLDPRGGFLLLRIAADEAEILTIGVVARRQGIGTALMQAGIAHARAAAAVAIYLEVAAGNEAARRLYGKLAFAQIGRRKGYYPNGEDAIVLRLGLDGHPE